MTVPYTFANQVGQISLAELDANFSAVGGSTSVANTVTNPAQPNITTVGTLTTLSVTGNVVGGLFTGNGSGLTGVVAIANVGVAAQLANGTTSFNIPVANGNIVGNIGGTANVVTFTNLGFGVVGLITATGNIQGSNFVTTGNVVGTAIAGNGARLTNLTAANLVGAVANATYANTAGSAGTANIANTASVANTVYNNSQPNITSVGTLTDLTISGNLEISSNSRILGDFSNSAPYSSRSLFQTTANSFTTVGAIPGIGYSSNVNTYAGFAAYNSTDVDNASYIVVRSLANSLAVTSARHGNGVVLPIVIAASTRSITLDPTGNISISGNVSTVDSIDAGNILLSGTVQSAIVSASGNTYSGNIGVTNTVTAGNVSITGTVQSAIVSASGNVRGVNLNTDGIVTATGNVYGGNIIAANAVTANTAVTNISFRLPVYANATARDAAITVPAAGMLIFNTATANFQGYNGTAWGNITLS